MHESARFVRLEVRFEFAPAPNVEGGAVEGAPERRVVQKWTGDGFDPPVPQRRNERLLARLHDNPLRIQHENIDAVIEEIVAELCRGVAVHRAPCLK